MLHFIFSLCFAAFPSAVMVTSVQGAEPACTPLASVQRAFPQSTGWMCFHLSDKVQLQRCLMPDKATHMYCVTRRAKGDFQLVKTHAVAAVDDQFSRFSLKDGTVLAYHSSGEVLVRLPLWDAPPALYAPAAEQVRLRLTGTDDNLLLCEAENLTMVPVLLRPGRVQIITTEDGEVTWSNLLVRLREETLLPPRGKVQLQLPIVVKRVTNPKGLTRKERVDLVYLADDVAPAADSRAIAPAVILQPGMPEQGELGGFFPIRLRDDLTVAYCPSPAGRADSRQLDFYRLRDGVWQFVASPVVRSTSIPRRFTCENNRVRVYDIEGRKLAEFQLP